MCCLETTTIQIKFYLIYMDKGVMVVYKIWTFIIQQIVTLSKYGHDALDICHP